VKNKIAQLTALFAGHVAKMAGVLGLLISCLISVTPLVVQAAEQAPKMSPSAKPVPNGNKVFKPDPVYRNDKYNANDQIEIYGGKSGVDAPRPLIELGRPIYKEGPLEPGINLVGRKNLVFPAFSIYGDLRTAVGYNENGLVETGLVAARLNLDIDLKLTATERLHALVRPLDRGGVFTNYEFFGDDRQQGDYRSNLNLDNLFFEGDAGAIMAGITDKYNGVDLPFSLGFLPLFFQNGLWVDDAFIGGAFAIPALNSKRLDISNMDITFFGGFDKVTTPAILDDQNQRADHSVAIYGMTTFIEANSGYWEAGIGQIDGEDDFDELSYTSATIAFSRRYGRYLSSSLRGVYTFDQERLNNTQQTADGWMFLSENSFVTSKPSTLIPYANFWAGFDRPQPLAGANGLLKNTGITFETNDLTGLPKLDDTGHDTFGGAIGLEYLFNLDQQIIVEASTVQIMGGVNDAGRTAIDDQYGFGLRYQIPIAQAWIVRADAMYGIRDNTKDIAGMALELRVKF
jgi:hypothetical protein